MKTVRLASFGLRGMVGESLTPDIVINYASAFASYLDGGRVLLGRDTRDSSPMLYHAALSALQSAGCEVLDLDICPMPMVQFLTPHLSAAGGLSITGGHNAMGWNALMLNDKTGALLEPSAGELVLESFHSGSFLRQPWDRMGACRQIEQVYQPYWDALEQVLDIESIRRKKYKVLVDPVGGAGSPFLSSFAECLGLTLIPLNERMSGYLPRDPEPRPRSALQMASVISHMQGDVGFVLSSDMSRMSIVTDAAEPTSEEHTFPLIAQHILEKHTGPLVTNICTTKAVDDLGKQHGVEVFKSRVGQPYIVSTMIDEDGVIGGEGSGSIVYPVFSPAYDGFLMMGLVLEAMAKHDCPVSELLSALPRYHNVKKSISCSSSDGYRALEMLKSSWPDVETGQVNLTDGFRVDWDDGWIHIRASMTQPLIRVLSESKDEQTAVKRAQDVMRMIRQVLA